MKILLLGSGGQLGASLSKLARESAFELISPSSSQANLEDVHELKRLITSTKPELVINAAAFTDVEKCEDAVEYAMQINAYAPSELAKLSNELGFKFVHFSTDYVFSGPRNTPWSEDDTPNPISVYAQSKLLGEKLIIGSKAEQYLIVRTSWLYSKSRKNFVKKVIYKLLYSDEKLNIVDDQIGQLTNVDDVSTLTFKLMQLDMATGIFHVSSSGSASWFEVARKIALLVGERLDRIQPISSSAYNARAKRPSYSVLCHEKITNLGLTRIDDWEMCLEKSIQEISDELRHEVEAGKW